MVDDQYHVGSNVESVAESEIKLMFSVFEAEFGGMMTPEAKAWLTEKMISVAIGCNSLQKRKLENIQREFDQLKEIFCHVREKMEDQVTSFENYCRATAELKETFLDLERRGH